MRLDVRVIARSSQEKIIKESPLKWKIYIRTSPERGKANEKLRELIALKLNVSKNLVRIIKGETSRRKIVEVPDVAS